MHYDVEITDSRKFMDKILQFFGLLYEEGLIKPKVGTAEGKRL